MKSKITAPILIAAVVIAAVLIGFLGWNQLKPPDTLSSAPPPFIDPVTRRPKAGGGGSGMPKQATGGAPAGGQTSGSQ